MRRVFMTRVISVDGSVKRSFRLRCFAGVLRRWLIDANLGGGIIKKRVALPGRGKRGSARTLVATNSANRWFFVFGFEKNDRDNINAKELSALKALASDLLRLGVHELSAAVTATTLQEICHEN